MKIEGSRNKKTNFLFAKIYSLWKSMYDRCYKESHHSYNNYGGRGVTICDKWKSLDGFIDDLDKIDGFCIDKFRNGELCLDKDKKFSGNKVYNLNNCTFISLSENNKYKPSQQKPFKAISPNGEIYIDYNQSDFANKHGLSQNKISECLRGNNKTHKKWKFENL